ncbi:transcriptional regulator, TetR family [Anaerocolumna jejuensis DSM 15929]|uniref:Transcriptional regulator, TetR family n=1 Tax=Anaerocolumna jejuensis DSM 15929 TaxID=1121322 RepID=A0A1M7BU84_9FIRM|nr:TetR/AcrR family transcriptional regulator [Anaerocolumna jejuensis]SHL58540.1 transcriptional regulator, TetR family [Anaerocolumna jejuensis DSM 15929]
MRELKSIEEKILDRALYLIGKNRSLNISVRAIAKEAEVNISAINYYFRTKEEMMLQMKELFIINTLSITSILTDTSMVQEEKLIYSVNEIMEYIIRYPGITVLLKDAKERTDKTSVRLLKASDEMTEKINGLFDNLLTGTENISYKRVIFWSAVNYPLDDNGFDNYDSVFLKDRENRITYIRQLLKMLEN